MVLFLFFFLSFFPGNRVKGSSSDPIEKEKEISKDLGDCVAKEESKETKGNIVIYALLVCVIE